MTPQGRDIERASCRRASYDKASYDRASTDGTSHGRAATGRAATGRAATEGGATEGGATEGGASERGCGNGRGPRAVPSARPAFERALSDAPSHAHERSSPERPPHQISQISQLMSYDRASYDRSPLSARVS